MATNKLKLARNVIVGLIVIYILYVIIVALTSNYTYQEQYKPVLSENATDQERAIVMANGVSIALENELNSIVGFLPNDLLFVPNLVDNRTSFQKGIIYATRPASDMIAKTVARYGQRDTIDVRLSEATSRYFTYGDNVWGFWFIYDAEGKYKSGIKNWHSWANSVGSTNAKNAGIYNIKSDDVYNILKYCVNMTDYALGLLNDENISHFKTDDVVYFTKGICLVTGNVLRAINAVDVSVAQRGGEENLQEALKRFDYINEFDPTLVLAGGNVVGDALIPNHIAALARHIDVANSRLNDMLKTMEK